MPSISFRVLREKIRQALKKFDRENRWDDWKG